MRERQEQRRAAQPYASKAEALLDIPPKIVKKFSVLSFTTNNFIHDFRIHI
jgi:hypothetical protein